MAMSCSKAARPGTFVRDRIQPMAKPNTTASTVATPATSSVLPKMWL
jgi:hypothetical protein